MMHIELHNDNVILSILVVSHNQKRELKRCLESIFTMHLSFPYEIIVSDDRSMDGTREMLETEYANRVVITYCNSDEGHCTNNSQRSGYNRCNAYPLAQGKYIAHVDADDYFRPHATVYEKQVLALEAHPECALAMSTCVCVQEGEQLENGRIWHFPRTIRDGEVLDSHDFIREDWFRINQCFMQRRNPDVNPVALYGKRYVDSVITYHHLQFGKVVYVDACDYVYVQHSSSVVGKLSMQSKDSVILWCLGLYIPLLIPSQTKDFFFGCYFSSIKRVIQMALNNYQLQEENYNSLSDLHVWIYDCFARKLMKKDIFRLKFTLFCMQIMHRIGWQPSLAVYLLRTLLYKK